MQPSFEPKKESLALEQCSLPPRPRVTTASGDGDLSKVASMALDEAKKHPDYRSVSRESFVTLRKITEREHTLLASHPMALRYLIAVINCVPKGEDEKDTTTHENEHEQLIDGLNASLRGRSVRFKASLPQLKAFLEEAESFNREYSPNLSHEERTAKENLCKAAAAKRSAFLSELKLFSSDYEKIAILIETRSEIPHGPAVALEMTLRDEIASCQKNAVQISLPIFEANRPLAIYLANSFAASGSIEVADLESEANRALLSAIYGYDPELGAPFGAYASTYMVGKLKKACLFLGKFIRLSSAGAEMLNKIESYEWEYLAKNGFYPEAKEIAAHFKASPLWIKQILDARHDPISMDSGPKSETPHDGIHNQTKQVADDSGLTALETLIQGEDIDHTRAAHQHLFAAIEKLQGMDRIILTICFKLPGAQKLLNSVTGQTRNPPVEELSQTKIAALLKTNESTLRMRLKQIQRKLRDHLKENGINGSSPTL